MRVLDNVASAANYPAVGAVGCQLGPLTSAIQCDIMVSNAPVYLRGMVAGPGAGEYHFTAEFPVLIAATISRAFNGWVGFQARDYIPASHAQVSAVLWEPSDGDTSNPLAVAQLIPTSGQPIPPPPPGDNLNFDQNGALVGVESTLNFIDGTKVAWTVTDNVGATRIDVTPGIVAASLVNADINAAAAIAYAKLALAGSILETDLAFDPVIEGEAAGGGLAGTFPNPTVATVPATALPLVSRSYAQTFDVVNTAAETTLFSQSIPGNTLGANGSVLVIISADWLDNVGTSTFTPRVKFGATTLWGDAGTIGAANANHAGVGWWFLLANLGATNSQRAAGTLIVGSRLAGSVAGSGSFTSGNTFATTFTGTSAIDTTAAATLAITWQWGAANASREIKGSATAYVLTT